MACNGCQPFSPETSEKLLLIPQLYTSTLISRVICILLSGTQSACGCLHSRSSCFSDEPPATAVRDTEDTEPFPNVLSFLPPVIDRGQRLCSYPFGFLRYFWKSIMIKGLSDGTQAVMR